MHGDGPDGPDGPETFQIKGFIQNSSIAVLLRLRKIKFPSNVSDKIQLI